jgi:hypothetical protein
MKQIEDPFKFGGGKAGTSIGYGQEQLLAFEPRPQFNRCSCGSVSGRVQQKIIQGLLQKHKISAD